MAVTTKNGDGGDEGDTTSGGSVHSTRVDAARQAADSQDSASAPESKNEEQQLTSVVWATHHAQTVRTDPLGVYGDAEGSRSSI